MKNIVTENPKGMSEHVRNFVCIKNNEVYVRIDNTEVPLVEYIRKIDKELYGVEHSEEYCNAAEFGEYMDGDRFTCDMYWALVGFADVRERLKYYEEKLKDVTVEEIAEIIARNCVAWDTSKDKREGLLPEVAVFENLYLYEKLTGEKYDYLKAIKKFHIGED